jgi:hypothetical protein
MDGKASSKRERKSDNSTPIVLALAGASAVVALAYAQINYGIPELRRAADGAPLVLDAIHATLSNPRLPAVASQLATDSLSSGVPYGILFYIISEALLVRYWRTEWYENNKMKWKYAMAAYNMVLSVYSFATCIAAFIALSNVTALYGNDCTLLFRTSPLFVTTTYLFYLSKYVEFLDTYFLVVAGKSVNWLQYYHHMGAVAVMWMLYHTQNEVVWIFVQFNSFIHTVMYFYFALTALSIPVPLKMVVTILQLLQLTIGNSITIPYTLRPCFGSSPMLMLTWAISFAYVAGLVVLFTNFFITSYLSGQRRKPTTGPLMDQASMSRSPSASDFGALNGRSLATSPIASSPSLGSTDTAAASNGRTGGSRALSPSKRRTQRAD